MKILHVCQLYYPSQGGNQVHLQLLSEKLAKLGEEVHVFTANAIEPTQFAHADPSFKPLPSEEKINGVFVRRFTIDYGLKDFLFKKIYNRRGGFRLLNLLMGQTYDYWQNGPLVPEMLLAIRRLKPNLIIASMNYPFTTYVCYLAKKLFGFKLVIMPITHVSDDRTFHPFLKKMYKAADGLIACTAFEQKHLISQGAPEDKVEPLSIGIEPDSFDGQDGMEFKQKWNLNHAPVVAYIGRKVLRKGIETLIDAMSDVWREFPDAKLLLAGQTRPSFLPIIKDHLDRLKPEDKNKVIQMEYFTEEEKKDLFAAIDILVMASDIDSFGIVYLEAWLSGKPVIACKNTAQESIVDNGVNGFLVEYGNSIDLAKALRTLLSDQALRERMGKAGREKVKETFNLEEYVRKVRQGYHQWVKGNDIRKSVKTFARKILTRISPDLEYRLVDQFHFNQLKRRPPELMWKAIAPCPEERLDAGRGQIGHELFVFGGFRWDGTVIHKVDIFDMKKEKWTARIDLPEDMAQTHVGVADDGKRYIYVVSGQLGDYCRPPTRDCFVMDAANRTFSKLPPLPKARYAPVVQLWRGRLHSVSGASEDRTTPTMDHWSIAIRDGRALENEWRVEPPIPRGGHHRASAVVDDALYVFGGQEGDYVAIPGDPEFRCTSKLTSEIRFPESFRLKSGAKHWERMADMPVLSSHTESGVLKINDLVFILGGDNERAAKKSLIKLNDEIQVYDAKTDSWKIIGRLPYRVKESIAGYYKENIYISTGQRDMGPDNSSAARRFERGTWKVKLEF